jgi:hypothetical protein
VLKTSQSALGLYRTPNQLGVAQEGAFTRLDECVIRSKDVVEPRLGRTLLANYIGGNSGDIRRFNALFQSSVGFLGQYGSGTTSGVKVVDGASTEILTNVSPPSAWSRTKFADCMKRCYVTSDTGLKRIDSSLSGKTAGGLVGRITTHSSNPRYNANGFLPLDSAVLYRADLVSFAPDGAEIVGPPSNRYYCRVPPEKNTGATGVVRASNVITVTTTLAHGFRVGDFVLGIFDSADLGANKFSAAGYTIASVPSATTFTISNTAADYTSTVVSAWHLGPAVPRVRVALPSTAAITDVVRLYRSEVVTSSYLGTPSDDVYQVFEAYLTATNISNGYVDIDDNTPEVLLGEPAYFAPSVEGETGSNDLPPLVRDVAAIGDVLVGVDLTYKHALEVRLLSSTMSPPQGLTFERSGYPTLELKSTFGPVTDEYFITYSVGSVARDIEATAVSLCDAVNTMVANTWLDAKYVSSVDDAPGRILFTARDFTSTAFTVKDSTSPTYWAPNLPASGTVATSKQETDPAGFVFSKPGQPDAFPGLQRGRAGAPGERGLRVLPVREKAIILKEESAWLLSGGWPQFRCELLDDTCGFPLPDTAAVMDSQVFTLSSIGVVAVSEAGVALVGSPIEGDTRAVSEQAARLPAYIAAGYTPHCLASWGAADELEHRYLLAIPSALGVPASPPTTELRVDTIFVFNASNKAWTRWGSDARHAHRWTSLSSSSRLAFALQELPAIAKENGLETPASQRYADYLGHTFISAAASDNTLSLKRVSGGANTTDGIEVGDALYNSTTGFSAIVTALPSVGYVTVDDATGIESTTGLKHLKGYEVYAEWVPLHGGALPSDKQLHSIVLALSDERFNTATVHASSELSGEVQVAKTMSSRGFGFDMARGSDGEETDKGFGNEPFGHSAPLRRERVQIPRDAQRAGFHSIAFRVKEAGAYWRLYGLSLSFEAQTEKGVR